mgnify:CR=1 FL=1
MLSTIGTYSQWLPLLAAAGESGEGYAKALSIALGLLSLTIFFTCGVFRELAALIKLPPILGDLIAGVVIGVSGLHFLMLEAGGAAEVNLAFLNFVQSASGTDVETVKSVFEDSIPTIIEAYAELGVGFLLFTIGLESDLDELLKVGVQASAVAVVGVALPFLMGFFGLTLLFGVPALPALFAGAALTATSIGITAKVLKDLGVLQSQEGQTIIGASILDDILGVVILAVVVSIAEKGQVEIGSTVSLIMGAILFVVAAVLMSRFFAPWFVTQLNKLTSSRGIGVLLLLFGMGLIARLIGLEGILGAFAAGLILSGTNLRERLIEPAQAIVYIFATIFFVSIGAKTDLSPLNPAIPENREGLIIAVFLILVAILGKIIAGYAAIGKEGLNRLAVGTGMIPRGEVGLVFAGLGSATGVLPPAIDVAIVVMVIATTFLGPPLLRVVFQSVTIEPVAETIEAPQE